MNIELWLKKNTLIFYIYFIGIGKTTYIQKLVEALTDRGVSCTGFITEEVRENDKRIGFDVVTLNGTRGILSRNKYVSRA